jgi:hypothetical protein
VIIEREREQDAAEVMAEGTLQLLGTWVGHGQHVDKDPYGVVLSLDAGVATGRLVGAFTPHVSRSRS